MRYPRVIAMANLFRGSAIPYRTAISYVTVIQGERIWLISIDWPDIDNEFGRSEAVSNAETLGSFGQTLDLPNFLMANLISADLDINI
jgi:hypothetical protein